VNISQACDSNSRQSNAERYAARRMSATEAAAFEDHFVACAECQREVRLASAIIGGLQPATVATRSVGTSRRVWTWAGGGLALAAGLAALMILSSDSRGELVALGAVGEPPAYLGIPVRVAGSPQDSLFESAMDSYANRRYAAAAAALRIVLAAGQDSVPARFFLATSLLLENRASEAADEFQRLIAYGDTRYRAEAWYYRAKALLRLGRAADARTELERLAPADGVAYDMGRALADSVARVRDR